MTSKPLHVGIIGGGLGGLTAAISIARAGARVTVLEAATELGEIGAGIQMFGNVSRFLIRTGVDEIIGDDLVRFEDFRNWTACDEGEESSVVQKYTGKMIGRIRTRDIERISGFPWWVVRRDHLHTGLAKGAERDGAEIIVDARIADVKSNDDGSVTVLTEKGKTYQFDLVIGADGINSTIRKCILPDLKPVASNKIAAYRAIVPYEEVFREVEAAKYILGNTMNSYCGPGGYVLLYPLSAGKELNVVTSFTQDHVVDKLEYPPLKEFRDHYKDFPPFINKILDLVKETSRWPLLTVPPTNRWSNQQRNIVLMGDAAHGMQNHIAQGAATSMEDGIFLGRIISEVVRGTIPLDVAIRLYEEKRIPRCWVKQQCAFCMGSMWGCDGDAKRSRDRSTHAEVDAFSENPAHPDQHMAPTYRTSMMMASPDTVPGILYYDAEGDADFAVCEYLQKQGTMDPDTKVVDKLREKWASAIFDNGIQYWKPPKRTSRL